MLMGVKAGKPEQQPSMKTEYDESPSDGTKLSSDHETVTVAIAKRWYKALMVHETVTVAIAKRYFVNT